MAKKMLSIEMGSATTRVVVMDYQSKKPKVYKCVEFETPEGAVKDGYINTSEIWALRDAFKRSLRQNKIRGKRVVFSVFSGKIISREIMLPGVKPHQISAIIESNLTEYFPIELNDYKITHMHITTFREGDNMGKHKVLIIAAENKLLEGYQRLAEEMGFNIVDIDYAGNSMYQAARQSAGAEAIVAVKVEEDYGLVTIIKQGTMVMQRTVNYNIGPQSGGQVSHYEAMRVLVGTLQRVIDFYVANGEENKIEQIYVMGGVSEELATLDLIAEQIQLPCRALDTVRGTAIAKKLEFAPINVFASAIGAGIKSVGFAADKDKERHETNYAAASVLVILLFMIIAAAMASYALMPYSAVMAEQEALLKKQQQYEPARAVHDQYQGMQALLGKVQYGRVLTERSNDGVLDFLAELEKKMPSDVEFTEFSSNDEQCVITMRVADKETAAGVIKMFRDFESLTGVSVESIVEEKEGEGTDIEAEDGSATIYFTITCVYKVEEHEEPGAATAETDAAADTGEAGAIE